MTKVYVLPQQGTPQELANLRTLVAALPCAEMFADGLQAIPADADVIVVLLGSLAANSVLLDQAVAAAIRSGKRVVAIWLPGLAQSAVPSVLTKFGGTIIAWNQAEAERVICEEESAWETAEGTSAPVPKFKRNKC